MAEFGNLQVDCACGETLYVPVTFSEHSTCLETNSVTATLTVDHAFIAAHIATHRDVAVSESTEQPGGEPVIAQVHKLEPPMAIKISCEERAGFPVLDRRYYERQIAARHIQR